MPESQEPTPQIPSPGEFIQKEMDQRGWSQRDLAHVLNRPLPTINEILQGKKTVMPEMAIELGMAFGNEPSLWMERESAYRLSLASRDGRDVQRRARLYDLAPIKEMEKRGWISETSNADSLEAELCRFFNQHSLDQEPQIGASLRSSIDGPINASQRAWCFRAKQLARAVKVGEYGERAFEKGVKQLRRLAAWPDSARKVSGVLASMGIRFVVIEPLAKTRIDGAALWLDEDSPVIAMSLRYDRIDSFWHTLGHELSHIDHRDGTSLDIDIVGDSRPPPPEQSAIERRADSDAAATWVDPTELQSFIVRVGPLYSRDRINQFANRLKIHPGIIIGQLQFRGEIGYGAMRETLVKIRDFVTAEAMTDGWGHVVKLDL